MSVIAIDFDGTCVTHNYPEVGVDIGAAPILKMLINSGHQLILFTMRSEINYLDDAINWFVTNHIPLYGINVNRTQSIWTVTNKAYAQLYIDDAALGCPLKFDINLSNRPFVDWAKVEEILIRDRWIN